MKPIYWTKYKTEVDEETGIITKLNELEEIQETELEYVPDGDGFEVDLGNIKYATYKKNPDNYIIENGKLKKK